jgi:WD40 repeat protein/uncharacterized caspase-like protein
MLRTLIFFLGFCATAAEPTLYLENGHSQPVSAVEFSPDGRFILTGSWDGKAKLWEAGTGTELRTFERDGGFVNAVAFSPNAQTVLTGSSDGVATLWDVNTATTVRRFVGHSRFITSVAFSSDGRYVVTGSGDRTARLWDAATGAEIRRFSGHSDVVTAAAFSADTRHVVTGSQDGTARLWDIETGAEFQRFSGHSDSVIAAAVSADGQLVLTGSGDKTARLWDVASGVEVRRFAGHSGSVRFVAFSRDGNLALTGGDDTHVRLWNWKTGIELQQYHWDGHFVLAASFSPDGRRLVAGGDEGAVLWNVDAGTEVTHLKSENEVTYCVAFSHESAFLLTAGTGGIANIWDVRTGKVQLLKGSNDPVVACSFSSDDKLVLTAGSGAARLWERSTGRELRRFKHKNESVSYAAFSPQTRYVVTAGETLRLWDAKTGVEVRRFAGGAGRPAALAFSPDGRFVVTGGGFDRTTRLWDASNGYEVSRFKVPDAPDESVTSVAFSPDGRFLVTGSISLFSVPRLWDVNGAVEVKEFVGHRSFTDSVAFSPDGSLILTGSPDKTSRLWNVKQGSEVRSLEGQEGQVWSVTFSPNGKLILTGGVGTTRLWESSGACLATLVTFPDGGWAIFDPEGRFDTNSLDGRAPLHWAVSDDPLHALPFEIFMRQYYIPRLLPRLLAGEKLPPVPNIGNLNRVQPKVQILAPESDPVHPSEARVRVRVARVGSSGAKDLRLFRNGQLVAFREGNIADGEYTFDAIRLPSQNKTVEFTAYAFNDDLVKSETAHASFEPPSKRPAQAARAFVVNIGINRNRAAGCDLQYAASDATALRDVLQTRLSSLHPQMKLLVANDAEPNGASRKAIQSALAQIAQQATPDDTFVLSFSGHGYTDEQGRFYLLPSDLEGTCNKVDQRLLASAISTDDLTEWLRPIDAGEMVMILDACYSGASVDSGDFKPGPMGSRGLGQLAYDKRIRILAASQSTQAAGEAPWLNMGFLSYALVKDGLEGNQADWQPKDGQIWLREWLSYAVERVPKMYEALRNGQVSEFTAAPRGTVLPAQPKAYQDQALQTPALFDFAAQDQNGFKLK